MAATDGVHLGGVRVETGFENYIIRFPWNGTGTGTGTNWDLNTGTGTAGIITCSDLRDAVLDRMNTGPGVYCPIPDTITIRPRY
jgi:hypothetical protein